MFGTEARLVVIFYRAKWGTTSFTRIEETAIRNRAYNKGYDFTLFIPRERVQLPEWLPKTRLWFGWERYGVKGAASVIEARLAELGSMPREEGVLEHTARMNREAEFQKRQGVLALARCHQAIGRVAVEDGRRVRTAA